MTNLLKIINLFQAFIELSKYNCNSSIKLESFLSAVLATDLLLFKIGLITEQDKLILQKAFQNSKDIWFLKKGYLYKLSSFKNIKHFEIRVIDLYNLTEHDIINAKEKDKLQTLFKQYQDNIYNNHLSILINDKSPIFAIETDILYTDINHKLIEIYENILNSEFIIQFIETANTKENNMLFEDYFVYLSGEIIKQHIIETNIILRFLVDFDLSHNNYFAYVEVEHSNNQDNKNSDNWYPLIEICFGDNEDEVYDFINKISDILSERVYYDYNNVDYIEVAEIYYNITYTYKDLLNFVKYLIFLAHTLNL